MALSTSQKRTEEREKNQQKAEEEEQERGKSEPRADTPPGTLPRTDSDDMHTMAGEAPAPPTPATEIEHFVSHDLNQIGCSLAPQSYAISVA